MDKVPKKFWILDDYVVGVIEFKAGQLSEAEQEKEYVEFLNEIRRVSRSVKLKVPIPSCDGCIHLEAYGRGHYGFCRLAQKVVNTTYGCLQKEVKG